MLSSALLLAATLMPQGVVINEFVYDHSGTDVDEFIELYNSNPGAVDISGWVIDAEGTTSSNFDFTIPPLSSIPGQGFFVIKNSVSAMPADASVTGAPAGGWLQNGAIDSIMLRNLSLTVVDAVTYEATDVSLVLSPDQVEGPGIRGAINNFGYTVGSLAFKSFSRIADGFDTDNNGRDFRIWVATPGASNNATFDVNAADYNLDVAIALGSLTAGTPVPTWKGSCTDPTIIGYPVGITASPLDDIGGGTPAPGSLIAQMGCTAANDSIGGSAWLETKPAANVVFESYVYIDTTPTIAGAAEHWHIGLQGTSAEFFNLPVPVWTGAFSDTPDVTGVGLSCVVNDTSATLSLVDYGDGSIANVLATMPAPSGWTRIRVQAGQGFVEARVGGTILANDGTAMTGATVGTGAFGGVYVGYRKSGVTGMSIGRGASPLYMDTVIVRASGPVAKVQCFGTPTANTLGDPLLGVTGLPYIGSTGFGFAVSGMLPNAPWNFLLGTGFPGGGIDVSPFLPTPIGLTLWVDLNISGNPPLTTDGSGNGTFALPLSTNVNQIGISLFAQAFQADPGLFVPPVTIPLSATKAVRFTIGAF